MFNARVISHLMITWLVLLSSLAGSNALLLKKGVKVTWSLFQEDSDVLSLTIHVTLPTTFHWVVVGFQNVPADHKPYEDLALIKINQDNSKEVSSLKTMRFDEVLSRLSESDYDIYNWGKHGRRKTYRNYLFTLERRVRYLRTCEPVILVTAHGHSVSSLKSLQNRFHFDSVVLDSPQRFPCKSAPTAVSTATDGYEESEVTEDGDSNPDDTKESSESVEESEDKTEVDGNVMKSEVNEDKEMTTESSENKLNEKVAETESKAENEEEGLKNKEADKETTLESSKSNEKEDVAEGKVDEEDKSLENKEETNEETTSESSEDNSSEEKVEGGKKSDGEDESVQNKEKTDETKLMKTEEESGNEEIGSEGEETKIDPSDVEGTTDKISDSVPSKVTANPLVLKKNEESNVDKLGGANETVQVTKLDSDGSHEDIATVIQPSKVVDTAVLSPTIPTEEQSPKAEIISGKTQINAVTTVKTVVVKEEAPVPTKPAGPVEPKETAETVITITGVPVSAKETDGAPGTTISAVAVDEPSAKLEIITGRIVTDAPPTAVVEQEGNVVAADVGDTATTKENIVAVTTKASPVSVVKEAVTTGISEIQASTSLPTAATDLTVKTKVQVVVNKPVPPTKASVLLKVEKIVEEVIEHCEIDPCSYNRCPSDTKCVVNEAHCTSMCQKNDTSTNGTDSKPFCLCNSHWYDFFVNNKNSVYFAVIGISAFCTGIIVLCIACCCAQRAKKPKIPSRKHNKVSFYDVDNMETSSSADEEVEFLKDGKKSSYVD